MKFWRTKAGEMEGGCSLGVRKGLIYREEYPRYLHSFYYKVTKEKGGHVNEEKKGME